MGRTFRWLNLRPWRAHPLRTVLLVVAVAAGVTVALAVLIQYRSLTTSIERTGDELAGVAPLRVVGPTDGSLTPGVLERVRGAPGVAAAVPMVQAVSEVVEPSGDRTVVMAVGVDCSVEALTGPVGCLDEPAPGTSGDPVVVSRALDRIAPGGALRTNGGRLDLGGAVVHPALDRVGGGRVVALPMDSARRLFSRPGYDVIYVEPEPGTTTERVARALAGAAGPGATVLDAADQPGLLRQATAFLPQLGLIGLVAAVVGAMLVHSITSLTLAERRRELALGAALGRTRAGVMFGCCAEAGLQGIVGGALGVGAATAVAHVLVGGSSSLASQYGVTLQVHVDPVVVAAGCLLGAAMATAAAAVPAWRAGRVDIAAELYDRSASEIEARRRGSRRAWIAGLAGAAGLGACLASGWRGAIYPWQPVAGNLGVLAATGAFLGLSMTLGRSALRRIRVVTDRTTGITHLAGTQLASSVARNGGMLVAIAAAVTLGGFLASLVPAIEAASTRYAHQTVGDRLVVSPLGLEDSALDVRVPPSWATAVSRVPGVAAVHRVTWISVGQGTDDWIEVFADEGAPLRYPAQLGRPSAASLRRGEVAVGTGLARTRSLRPGSTLTVPTTDGTARLRVGAVWSDPAANGFEATMSVDTLTALFGPQAFRELAVVPEPGVDRATLAERIRSAGIDPDLQVWAPDAYADEVAGTVRGQLRPFTVMQRSLVGVVLVSTLATLLLVSANRRRELAIVTAVGLSPGRLFRTTLVETALLGAVGAAFGLLSSVCLTVAIRSTLAYLYGITPPLRISVSDSLLTGTITLLMAVVGAAWPAWRTARLSPALALQHE